MICCPFSNLRMWYILRHLFWVGFYWHANNVCAREGGFLLLMPEKSEVQNTIGGRRRTPSCSCVYNVWFCFCCLFFVLSFSHREKTVPLIPVPNGLLFSLTLSILRSLEFWYDSIRNLFWVPNMKVISWNVKRLRSPNKQIKVLPLSGNSNQKLYFYRNPTFCSVYSYNRMNKLWVGQVYGSPG